MAASPRRRDTSESFGTRSDKLQTPSPLRVSSERERSALSARSFGRRVRYEKSNLHVQQQCVRGWVNGEGGFGKAPTDGRASSCCVRKPVVSRTEEQACSRETGPVRSTQNDSAGMIVLFRKFYFYNGNRMANGVGLGMWRDRWQQRGDFRLL